MMKKIIKTIKENIKNNHWFLIPTGIVPMF